MMLAAVLAGPGDIQVRRVPVPSIGQKDALIRVACTGICGSDLSGFKYNAYNRPGDVMGHEFVGHVERVGASVEGIALGDRVTGYSAQFCGKCSWCVRKQWHLCPDLFSHYTGYGESGAFAEFTAIRGARLNRNVFLVPASLGDEAATLVEPVGVYARADAAFSVGEAESVLIVGGGVIGQIAAQALTRRERHTTVVLTEPSAERREVASRIPGIAAVLDPRQDTFPQQADAVIGRSRRHFGSTGMADMVLETSGSGAGLRQAIDLVRPGGTVVCIGVGGETADISTSELVHKELRIVGCMGTNFPAGLQALVEHTVDASALITHRFALSDIEGAFATLLRGEGVKAVISVT
ncbi:unannotated protein [freshwater metagenome]|uniref:Unannotated protein n=1 Tax=freshwater metagenome TaxID=449393 RepID=A0A6J6ZG01_9ZZZZ